MSISSMQPHQAAQVLGVLKAKNYRSVRKRWRQLATEHHPDKNPGHEKQAEAQFKTFNDAFDVLQNYQKTVGQWPIPRGYTAPLTPGFRPPPPTNPPPQPSVRAKHNRRRWRQSPPPPPPQPHGETRDRSWRKDRQPVQEPFSFTTGYGYEPQATLVHRDSFNQKLNQYLNRVFPNEAAANQQMKTAFGHQFQVGDVKDILANHQYGNSPINIEYTPTGRRVSWDTGPAPVPPPSSTPPQAPKQTSGPRYGGNPLSGQPEATPQPNTTQPLITLSVHPLAYERWYHASRGTGAATLLPSVMTHPNGATNTGHFMVSYIGNIPHVNGVPCTIVINPNAPVR